MDSVCVCVCVSSCCLSDWGRFLYDCISPCEQLLTVDLVYAHAVVNCRVFAPDSCDGQREVGVRSTACETFWDPGFWEAAGVEEQLGSFSVFLLEPAHRDAAVRVLTGPTGDGDGSSRSRAHLRGLGHRHLTSGPWGTHRRQHEAASGTDVQRRFVRSVRVGFWGLYLGSSRGASRWGRRQSSCWLFCRWGRFLCLLPAKWRTAVSGPVFGNLKCVAAAERDAADAKSRCMEMCFNRLLQGIKLICFLENVTDKHIFKNKWLLNERLHPVIYGTFFGLFTSADNILQSRFMYFVCLCVCVWGHRVVSLHSQRFLYDRPMTLYHCETLSVEELDCTSDVSQVFKLYSFRRNLSHFASNIYQ